MIMAAVLATVKKIVYENLSITGATYGTIDTDNKRFKSDFIDDAIVAADIKVVNLLRKYKQDFLLQSLYSTISATSLASGDAVPANWSVVSVTYGSPTKRSVEITYPKYRLLENFTWDATAKQGYHTFQDGKIYHTAPSAVTVTYINLTHPSPLSALKSPDGFENVVASFATAHLLMKRMDRPEESKFYSDQAYTFLQEYGIPESPKQETSDLQ